MADLQCFSIIPGVSQQTFLILGMVSREVSGFLIWVWFGLISTQNIILTTLCISFPYFPFSMLWEKILPKTEMLWALENFFFFFCCVYGRRCFAWLNLWNTWHNLHEIFEAMRRHEQFLKKKNKGGGEGEDSYFFIQWSHLLKATPRYEVWGRAGKESWFMNL